MMAEQVRLASVHDRATARALLTEAEAEGHAPPAASALGAAVTAWETAGRPYAAACGLREAETGLAAGDRTAAAAAAGTALERARDLGSVWLVSELESLYASARLPLDGVAPVALNARRTPSGSRRVSARCWRWCHPVPPIARSASAFTWRRRPPASTSPAFWPSSTCSRTEAAAVAHRQGMAGTAA